MKQTQQQQRLLENEGGIGKMIEHLEKKRGWVLREVDGSGPAWRVDLDS